MNLLPTRKATSRLIEGRSNDTLLLAVLLGFLALMGVFYVFVFYFFVMPML